MDVTPKAIYYDEAGNVIEQPSTDRTLTDFQRLRLETAAQIHSNGVWTETGAMEAADRLINLVLSTPFKANWND